MSITENRSTVAEGKGKNQVSCFLDSRCTVCQRYWSKLCHWYAAESHVTLSLPTVPPAALSFSRTHWYLEKYLEQWI